VNAIFRRLTSSVSVGVSSMTGLPKGAVSLAGGARRRPIARGPANAVTLS
jgi:hypothetical protein